MQTMIALYANSTKARDVVYELRNNGISLKEINVMSNNAENALAQLVSDPTIEDVARAQAKEGNKSEAYYESALRQGGSIVAVRADDGAAEMVSGVLRAHAPIDMEIMEGHVEGWDAVSDEADAYFTDIVDVLDAEVPDQTEGPVEGAEAVEDDLPEDVKERAYFELTPEVPHTEPDRIMPEEERHPEQRILHDEDEGEVARITRDGIV